MSFLAAGGSLAAIIAAMGEGALAAAPAVAGGAAAAGATAAAGTGAALGAGALAGTGAALGATEAGLAGAGGVAGETLGTAAPLAAQSLPEVAASGPGSITETLLGGGNSMNIDPMAVGNAPGMNLPEGLPTNGGTGSWLDTLGEHGYGGPAQGGGIMTPMEGITGEAPMEKAMLEKLGLNSVKGIAGKAMTANSIYEMVKPKPQPAPQLPQAPARKQLTAPAPATSAEMQSILQSLPPELRQMYQQLLQ